MSSYLFADTGTIIGLARAGLLDQLLPENNGGRQLVVTQEVYLEIQKAGNSGSRSAPIAIQWIKSKGNNSLTLLDDTVVTNPTGDHAGERSIAAYLRNAQSLTANSGFAVPVGSNSLVVAEDPSGMNDFIVPALNPVSPAPETTTGYLSNRVLSGDLAYSDAVSGWSKTVTGPYLTLNAPTTTDPHGVNIFGTTAVGTSSPSRQIGSSTYAVTDATGWTLGSFIFRGNATSDVSYVVDPANPNPEAVGVTIAPGTAFGVCTASGPLKGTIWLQSTGSQSAQAEFNVGGVVFPPGTTVFVPPTGGYEAVPTASLGGGSPQDLCNSSSRLFDLLTIPGRQGSLGINDNGFSFADGAGNATHVSYAGEMILTTDEQTKVTAALSSIINAERRADGDIVLGFAPTSSGLSRALVIDDSTGQVSYQSGGATVFSKPAGSALAVYSTGAAIRIESTSGAPVQVFAGNGAQVNVANPTGTADNSRLDVGGGNWSNGAPAQQNPAVVEPRPDAPGGLGFASGAFHAATPNINANGYLPVAQNYLVTGNVNWARQTVQAAVDDFWRRLQLPNVDVWVPDIGMWLNDYMRYGALAAQAAALQNIDPLVLDLDGDGVELTSWIETNIFFDTLGDGKLHQTGWVADHDGILALDLDGNGRIDSIKETISVRFNGGSFADGIAALAQPGATSFSRATSLTNAATGRLYFDDLRVWVDANHDAKTDAGELKTLAELGVSSISLAGAGNKGENIAGNDILNRTTFAKTDGTTGQVASVDFQVEGAAITTSDLGGATVIKSEGSASVTSYVVTDGAGYSIDASSFTLADGTHPNAFYSTTGNDSFLADATDTRSYWLGGGSGSLTLRGGAGIGDDVFNAAGMTTNAFLDGAGGNDTLIGGIAAGARRRGVTRMRVDWQSVCG